MTPNSAHHLTQSQELTVQGLTHLAPDPGTTDRLHTLLTAFRRRFGSSPMVVTCSPGRVNLLGEHTDYNEGFVLPIAIDLNILLAARPRPDRTVTVCSLNLDEAATFSLDDVPARPPQRWAAYVQGVAWALTDAGHTLPGLDAVLHSTVPMGGGLSSSAALELAFAWTWNEVGELGLPRRNLALLCQRAEVEFVGMPCGIMDQFVVALGQERHALCIDCRDLSYTAWPLPDHVRVVTCDTNVRRELVGSEYAVRRQQCEEAVRLLRPALPAVRALRDVTPDDLEGHRHLLPEVIYRRAHHVVMEGARMRWALQALKEGDVTTFGRLMNEAHVSLRDDYQVSSPELDAMWAAANAVPGCYGARLTGAGFGGNVVAVVEQGHLSRFLEEVPRRYRDVTGREAVLRVVNAAAGVNTLLRA